MSKEKGQKLRPIHIPLYSYWQALYLAFFAKNLYIDVVKRWRGFGALYLLLLIAVASVPFAARMTFEFITAYKHAIEIPFKNLPHFYIQNGTVFLDKPMPYKVKNNRGQVVAIIDTTGEIKNLRATSSSVILLVTKHKLYYRAPELEFLINNTSSPKMDKPIYEHRFNQNENAVFDAAQWLKTIGFSQLKYILIFLIYPLLVMSIYGFYVVGVPLFAFLGQLLAKVFFDVKVTFKESCRLLAVSATPQVVCLFLFLTINILFPGLAYAYIALLSAYFCFAIIVVKHERRKMVPS